MTISSDIPPAAPSGRGTGNKKPSRYLATVTEAVDDGWWREPEPDRPGVPTQVFADRTRQLITTNQSPDVPFSQSINPYKGCEHGCIYCFARPTHAYLDLSPGLDFETLIFRKTGARQHLIAELSRSGYVCSVLAMGTNTDPYQPVERQYRVTREILETLCELRHPVSIVTKSKLVLRDLDLLKPMAEQGLATVHVSVTTLDNALKTRLEPRTASPAARLRTVAELRANGIPTGVLVAPVIPFINDHELEAIVAASAQAGAQAAGYILLRLPLEVRELFEDWLAVHYPLKARRVMSAVRDTRGGRTYSARWHKRMVGEGQIADLLRARFHAALKKQGLAGARLPDLRTDLFQPPPQEEDRQLDLFC